MICLLPTSPRKIRNDGEAVTSPPFLNPTTRKGSGESMGKANTSKLSLEEQATKVCTKCGEEKSVEEFSRHSQIKSGFRPSCKQCASIQAKEYHKKNRTERLEKQRKHREQNKDRINYNSRQYYLKNKSKISVRIASYQSANADRIKEKRRLYLAKNKNKILLQKSEYDKKRKSVDQAYKLKVRLRNRLYHAIRCDAKSGSAIKALGCTAQQACEHIESLFDEKMTWQNWGTYWHLDHIFPLAKANLENRSEFLAVNNWRNLQPLAITLNIIKNDKVTPAARRLFNKLVKEFS